MEPSSHEIKILNTLKEVSASEWNRLVSDSFPFSSYEYLLALERSDCVGVRAGWVPLYVTIWREGKIQAATFLYVKNNSYGEYIFDWGWANAYHSHGVPYFPKLVSAVPFTPATGAKLLVASGTEKELLSSLLIKTVLELLKETQSSSAHFLFIPQEEISSYPASNFLIRHSFQYHWHNVNYATFDGFLDALKSRKRKQVKHERHQVLNQGITVEVITGAGLTEARASLMFQFYLTTIEKMGAIPYLNEGFFRQVFKTMSSEIIFLVAMQNGKEIAGSLSYLKGNVLYGRYWGSIGDFPSLHFELCYYRLIEIAIAKGVQRFEAGAQGEHKIQRGFLPALTYSAHAIVHPAFKSAIASAIENEKETNQEIFRELLCQSPYSTK